MRNRLLIIPLLVLSLLLALMLSACDEGGGDDPSRSGSEFIVSDGVEIKWAFYTHDTKIADEIFSRLNEKLNRDGVNLSVSPYYLTWDKWMPTIDTALASGDHAFDIFNAQYSEYFNKWVAYGLLADVAPFIDAYPALMKTIKRDKWDTVTFGK